MDELGRTPDAPGLPRARASALQAVLLALVFAPGLARMAALWLERPYLGHGFLVPLASAWIAAGIVPRLRRRCPAQPDPRGAVALLAALGLHVFALGAGSATLSGLAVVLGVAAFVWTRFGLAWLRALVFPLGYLLFMVPPPDDWIAPAIVALQLFVSRAAVELLQGAGFAIHRSGNVLELPGGETLFVAEACSGITSVITLVPIAALVAWFTLRTLRMRAALVAAVVPIAMLANLLRVLGTVLAAERHGVERITRGSLHDAAGVAVYVLATLAVLGLARALGRLERRREGVHLR